MPRVKYSSHVTLGLAYCSCHYVDASLMSIPVMATKVLATITYLIVPKGDPKMKKQHTEDRR